MSTRTRLAARALALLLVAAQVTIASNKMPTNTQAGASRRGRAAGVASVTLPNRSPLVSIRVLFMTGSAYDPPGKEGVAALTAALIAQGGSREMSYEQILEAFYPMAAGFGSQTDKEMTVFYGTTHADNLERYYQLVRGMLLDPGFREEDFKRLKADAVNFLKVSLRESNDEELGKEELYNIIYAGHPYGHHNIGRVSSLERLTIQDVRDFYRRNYTRANLVLGLAGGYPADFKRRADADFARLPAGRRSGALFSRPRLAPGMKIELVKRDTRSTAISLGFPIAVNRSHKDFPALALVASYFGQHRSSNSYLYQRIRELRGLNYGDYSYIEYFPRGMFQFEPDPNLGRQQQIFQIWIRPVEPQNGHFTLRAALYEYDKLVRDGMTQETFEATREFLTKFANILTATQDAQLGYALDSRYYRTPEFTKHMRDSLARLTLADVNRAIRQHLKPNTMRVVMITKDAEGLRDAIVSNRPSPITYAPGAIKPADLLEEDKVISTYRIGVAPADVTVIPVERVFE
ncbi:MAG TPA: pitrilysin family protein [Pyrinomonadaceae bacterium]|nr:pitrilysin family protein [Pyrinomonadaceae bacterium]